MIAKSLAERSISLKKKCPPGLLTWMPLFAEILPWIVVETRLGTVGNSIHVIDDFYFTFFNVFPFLIF